VFVSPHPHPHIRMQKERKKEKKKHPTHPLLVGRVFRQFRQRRLHHGRVRVQAVGLNLQDRYLRPQGRLLGGFGSCRRDRGLVVWVGRRPPVHAPPPAGAAAAARPVGHGQAVRAQLRPHPLDVIFGFLVDQADALQDVGDVINAPLLDLWKEEKKIYGG
jgi:hypothetical protein